MVDYGITGPQVRAMNGGIYASAQADQQAGVNQQSRLLDSAKSGGAPIPVPSNQPAYPEQAAGNQSTQNLTNQINATKAGALASSEYDSKVGGRRRRHSSKRRRRHSSKRRRRHSSKRRNRKYYRR